MTSKAVSYQTNTDRMIKLNNDSRDLFALHRQASAVKTFASSGGESISPAGPGAGNFLKISGGTMMGAIGFNPALVQIASGHINISQTTPQAADFSTYVLMTGEGTPDDLMWIDGASYNGQYLILQGTAEQVINLLHASNPGVDGNILTADGGTLVMDGSLVPNVVTVVTLIFDVTVAGFGAWRIVSVSSGSAGGGIPPGNIDLHCDGLVNVGFINFCEPLQQIRSFDSSSGSMLFYTVPEFHAHQFEINGVPKWTIKGNTNTSNADINMKTWDIKEIDRAIFKFDSGAALGANTPQIYVSRPGGDTKDHLTYNSSLGSHIWANQNLIGMQLDHQTLIKQTKQAGGNIIEWFADYQPADETPLATVVGSARRSGGIKQDFTKIIHMVNSTFANNYSGSLIFQVNRNSPNASTFIKLNENNSNTIRAYKNLDMFIHDIERVDRLRFTANSSNPVNFVDVTIYESSDFGMVYNAEKFGGYYWTLNDNLAARLETDVANNRVFSVHGESTDINSKPVIALYDVHPSSMVGQAIGKIDWSGTKEGTTNLTNYADILVRYETRGISSYGGSMQFNTFRNGAPQTWFAYNLANSNLIDFFHSVDFNAFSIWFDQANGNGILQVNPNMIFLSNHVQAFKDRKSVV